MVVIIQLFVNFTKVHSMPADLDWRLGDSSDFRNRFQFGNQSRNRLDLIQCLKSLPDC